MSDIDLTEAEDALLARYFNNLDETVLTSLREGLRDALPHIERQVREQVAQEIEATKTPGRPYEGFRADDIEFGKNVGRDEAAAVARGEQA